MKNDRSFVPASARLCPSSCEVEPQLTHVDITWWAHHALLVRARLSAAVVVVGTKYLLHYYVLLLLRRYSVPGIHTSYSR